MFLADDDLFEFYNEKIRKISKNVVPPKVKVTRIVCHFFIPSVPPKSSENENISETENQLIKKEQLNAVDNFISVSTECNNAFKPQIRNKHSLLSLPLTTTKTKEMCHYTDQDIIIKNSFSTAIESPKPIEELNMDFRSEIKDYLKKNVSCKFQRSRLNSSPSHETLSSSSCSLFTVNSSVSKKERRISSSYYHQESFDEICTDSPSEICSSSSFTNTFNVDIDIEIVKGKDKLKCMEPFVLLERLKLKTSKKRKRFTTIEHISSESCYNADDRRRYPEEIYKRFNRVIESDEETMLATDDSAYAQSLEAHRYIEIENSRTRQRVLVDDDPFHCFKCNLEFKTFCDQHPVEKILNLNVKCPFIEYMLDETFDKYMQPSIVRDCYCRHDEIDHILQSLPDSLQLKETKVSEIGISSTCIIVQGTIIGPYLGEVVEFCNANELNSNPYKTRQALKKCHFSSCIESAFKSNWLRCINFSISQNESNLRILHRDQKVFFQATKDIESEQELIVLIKCDSSMSKKYQLGEDLNVIHDELSLESNRDVDYTILPEEYVENIPFNGTKYSKEMIVDIAKIWRKHPQMTIGKTLKIISEKHPEARELSERYLSRITRKYHLRHKGGANIKFDSQMKEYARGILESWPLMSVNFINIKLRERFPHRPILKNEFLRKLICYYNLRPSKEIIENKKYMIQRRMTDDLLSVEASNSNGLESVTEINKERYNSKDPGTKVSEINNERDHSQVPEPKDVVCEPIYDNNDQDPDLYENNTLITDTIRDILRDNPFKYVDDVLDELRQRLPQIISLNIETVKRIMNENGLCPRFRYVKKIDEEMKRVIFQLRQENASFSVATINRHLRRLLPHKPFVQQNSIYVLLRKFNFNNKK